MPRKILILGCGYVGTVLAHRLRASGHAVTGWVRSEESAAALRAEGFTIHVGDIGNAEDWQSLPTHFDVAIHCASSNRSGPEVYASVYRNGLRNLIRHLPQARLLFTSSTSVYAQTDGSVVTENSPAEPQTETGKILREAEQIGLDHAATILRLAGIYGPGRGVLVARLKRDEAVIEGDGLRWINQIHREDAASAIAHAIDHAEPAEIYNVSDNEPVNYLTLYQWACAQLNKPMPPFGPVNAARKRGVTHKHVSNAKLRATGWEPQFATFREGYGQCLDLISG